MDIGTLNSVTGLVPVTRLSTADPSASTHGGVNPDQLLKDSDEARETVGLKPVEEAISSIQEFVQTIRRNLAFSMDEVSGRVVVKVTDSASGEVIRQIPSEDALKLAESLSEVRSLLFRAEA
ncbi:flagellar protein FlaG [Pseudomonas sp. TCU-HL1]|uniref:flagellar protein FlaG n=1 Tax=Pseudomonas sp. TCU-HL1 TaxID=1856685 RepID=UPI00083E2DCB|nr:flagellar protein FlaG [Pseudomonas sp. TCU-HL1]AOE86523.1 flagellar protein FlaG [Pseudomonas sp. TCU-HL1]